MIIIVILTYNKFQNQHGQDDDSDIDDHIIDYDDDIDIKVIVDIRVITVIILTVLITIIVMMLKLRELEEGRALEQGSGILPGLRAMVARAEVMVWMIMLLVDSWTHNRVLIFGQLLLQIFPEHLSKY